MFEPIFYKFYMMNFRKIRNRAVVFCYSLLLLFHYSCTDKLLSQIETGSSLIESFETKFAPDQRTAVFSVEADGSSGQLILKGETNLPEAYRALKDSLVSIGIELVDSVRVLPDDVVGNQQWGLVTISVMPLRQGASYSLEMVSQVILGTPVKVLDRKGNWYRIQTPDLYIGWAEEAGLALMIDAEIDAWKQADRYVYTQMSGWAFDKPQGEADVVADLVLGSIVEVSDAAKGFLHIQLPDKREGYVKADECTRFDEWERMPPTAEYVIKTAKKLLGSPYLWGGTSTKGIDCSGFTKTAYFSQGVLLARDASQQARYGKSLPIDSLNFEPGDLLFFGRSEDHITHVGLYIGDDHFIHSSGRVKINSFNSKDADFDPGRRSQLVAACRILNSLDTEQITPIKNHPWYN